MHNSYTATGESDVLHSSSTKCVPSRAHNSGFCVECDSLSLCMHAYTFHTHFIKRTYIRDAFAHNNENSVRLNVQPTGRLAAHYCLAHAIYTLRWYLSDVCTWCMCIVFMQDFMRTIDLFKCYCSIFATWENWKCKKMCSLLPMEMMTTTKTDWAVNNDFKYVLKLMQGKQSMLGVQ